MIGCNGFEAILFDLDGTLVDSLPVMRNVYDTFARGHGFSPRDEEFNALNGPSLEEIVEYLQRKHKIEASVSELLEEYGNLIAQSYIETVRPFQGVVGLLEHLRDIGKRVFMVTSSSKALVLEYIARNTWAACFEGYVFGDDVEKSKPSGDIYRLALKRFGLTPGNVIVIEDSVNGVLAARDAGLSVYGVGSEGEALVAAGAVDTFTSMDDVAKRLS